MNTDEKFFRKKSIFQRGFDRRRGARNEQVREGKKREKREREGEMKKKKKKNSEKKKGETHMC